MFRDLASLETFENDSESTEKYGVIEKRSGQRSYVYDKSSRVTNNHLSLPSISVVKSKNTYVDIPLNSVNDFYDDDYFYAEYEYEDFNQINNEESRTRRYFSDIYQSQQQGMLL